MNSGNGTIVAPKVPLPSIAPEPSLPGVVTPPKKVENNTDSEVTPPKVVTDGSDTTGAVVTPAEIP